ncbi:MAG TPA: anhydro-N-acetylmuramic acid kinase, partial [Edaphobacter sp.]|nr:anhydro-N-acetylmuramic acid kinase [Edaphobacter sp.]
MTRKKEMMVAGVMSGTSADGVDVALCRIRDSASDVPKIKLIGAREYRYPKEVRSAVLAAMDAKSISVAEMSRLHWRLGEIYAEAVQTAAKEYGVKIDLVGNHGQTIYHQAR